MRCSKCGAKARGRYSPLGEPVCDSCDTIISGLVVGTATGGLPGGLAGPGILGWIRGAMRPRRKAPDRAAEPEPTSSEE